MHSQDKTSTEQRAFEIINATEAEAVFQRVFERKKRKKKGRINFKRQHKIKSPPTVTLHYFTTQELSALKTIESEIRSKTARELPRRNFFKAVYDFLEIK